jgi:hypothetical protein
MRFIRCGSKMFKPDAVTAVHLDQIASSAGKTEVWVVIPGTSLFFRGAEAAAVRAYFLSIHATDLLRRDEDEAPEQVAANHTQGEC